MVELGNIALKDDLIGVIDRALDAGVDADTFTEMVVELVKARRVSDANDIVGVLDAAETPPEDAGDVIQEKRGPSQPAPVVEKPQPVRVDEDGVPVYLYGNVPENLIDVPRASQEYGVKTHTLHNWIRQGKLLRRGRIIRAPQGAATILIDKNELPYSMNDPTPLGTCSDGLPLYLPGLLPDNLIDLPSAAKKYGIPVRTLRGWVHRGRLPRRGRLKGKASGGGYIVTEESAILYCRDNPRKPWHTKSAMS